MSKLNCDGNALQQLLNDGYKEQSVTTTYYSRYKEYVMIDWRRYDGQK